MCSVRRADPNPVPAGVPPGSAVPDAASGAPSASARFRTAVRGLEACVAGWDRAGHSARLARALHRHVALWASLEVDFEESLSALPPGLAEDLLRLARFIDLWTAEVLERPEPSRLRAMIEIDRGIAVLLATPQNESRGRRSDRKDVA
jgi:hypothetical protein